MVPAGWLGAFFLPLKHFGGVGSSVPDAWASNDAHRDGKHVSDELDNYACKRMLIFCRL